MCLVLYVAGEVTYKLHYAWPEWTPGSDTCEPRCFCFSKHRALDTPRLFNLNSDPQEKHQLNITEAPHAEIVDVINKAKEEHAKTTEGVRNQMGYLNQIGSFYMHPFCDFPWQMTCKEKATSSLNYKAKYI